MTSRRVILLTILAVSVALLVGALVRSPGTDTPPDPGSDLNVIVLGVDGLDWFLLGKYIDEGALPNLSRIFRSAVTGEVAADRPVLPHVGWTIVGRGRPLSAAESARMEGEANARLFGIVPDLVRLVEDRGGTAVAVGWPASWPLPRGEQPAVAPYAPESPTHTRSIAPAFLGGATGQTSGTRFGTTLDSVIERNEEKIDSEFAARIHTGPCGTGQADEDLAAVRWGYLADRIVLDVAGRIIAEDEPDLALVHLGGLDAAAHRFLGPAMPDYFEGQEIGSGSCADVVPNYYTFIDRAVERLLRLTDNRTLFILCSAYGTHPSTAAPPATGGHELGAPGVLIVRGPNLTRRGKTVSLTTADLAPTVLAALGRPVSTDMTGRVLVEIVPEDVLAAHLLRFAETPFEPHESTEAPDGLDGMERRVGDRMQVMRDALSR